MPETAILTQFTALYAALVSTSVAVWTTASALAFQIPFMRRHYSSASTVPHN